MSKPKRNVSSPIRLGVLDIETTNLKADIGRILCACVRSYDPYRMWVVRADEYREWNKGLRYDDKELVADLLAHLRQFTVLIGHNAVQFDIPFIQTRALIHGLDPLHTGTKIIDPVKMARLRTKFHSNRLDAIIRALGTPTQKTPLDLKVWGKAYGDGDVRALDAIVKHCKQDVDALAEITAKLRPMLGSKIDAIGSMY